MYIPGLPKHFAVIHASNTVVSGSNTLCTVSVFAANCLISSSLILVNVSMFWLKRTSVHFNAISNPSSVMKITMPVVNNFDGKLIADVINVTPWRKVILTGNGVYIDSCPQKSFGYFSSKLLCSGFYAFDDIYLLLTIIPPFPLTERESEKILAQMGHIKYCLKQF